MSSILLVFVTLVALGEAGLLAIIYVKKTIPGVETAAEPPTEFFFQKCYSSKGSDEAITS